MKRIALEVYRAYCSAPAAVIALSFPFILVMLPSDLATRYPELRPLPAQHEECWLCKAAIGVPLTD